MEQKMVIPGELPGLNQILNVSKSHWAKYHKLKKQYTTLVAILARTCLKPCFSSVHIDIHWFCRNKKRDPDNICSAKKFLLDGLVAAGILADDGWRCVSGFSDFLAIDRKNPRIEVVLRET